MGRVVRKKSKGKKKHAKFPRSAITDHLTGLYNRRYFDRSLGKFISESKKGKKYFSLLMIDVDNFKAINDKHGHLTGDKILINLAKILKQSIRRFDICFRYGGDEIAMLLPNATREVAENIVVRLKTKVETNKFFISGKDCLYLRLSIGLSVFPDDGLISKDLIRKADKALYQAKRKRTKRVETFILKTKLIPPDLKEKIILRPRLISLFKKNLNRKLILVVADAGYGKTTLLIQMVKNQNLPMVFYNLDKTDNDLMTFLSHLMYGFERLQPNLVERTGELLKHGTDVINNYELVIGTLINELMEKRNQKLFLFLDDYHVISDDGMVNMTLNYFIDRLPEIVRVVIASRTVPNLSSLAKWRAKQNLFELFRDGLRFTHDEIKTLLTNAYGVTLSAQDLKRVSRHTEGWVTGIQLILQSAGKDRKTVKETLNGYIAANQPLFEYFANEILAGESSKVQDFLIHSSVLVTMTPNICNNVLGLKNSSWLLRDLGKRNLFVSAVGKEEYKYHHLFQYFLRERFKDNKLRKLLNLRAAKYYQKRKQMESAIQHYLEARSFEKAAKLIVQTADQIEVEARHSMLGEWIEQIPEYLMQKYPELLVIQGNNLRIQGRLQKAKDKYVIAEQLFRKKGDKTGLANALVQQGHLLKWLTSLHENDLKPLYKVLRICPASELNLKIQILNLMGILQIILGDLKKAKYFLLKTYRVAKKLNDIVWLNTVENNLASLLVRQGEKQLAFQSYAPLIERIRENYNLEGGLVFANAAINALDLGNVEWAEQCLDRGWNLCNPYEDAWSQSALYQGFGILYIQKRDWRRAEKYLNQALNEFARLQWTQFEMATLRDLSRLYRYQGDFSKSEKYLERIRQRVRNMNSLMGAAYLREVSLLQVSRKQFDETEKNVKIMLRLARKLGIVVNEFFSYLVAAAVHLGKGKEHMAARFLRRAIRMAKTKGYSGILVRELWFMQDLLNLAQKYNIEKNYLLSLNLPKGKPMRQLKVYCFGELRLQDKTGKLLSIVWPTEKARSLFAFLIAHHKTPMHRDLLMERLWPNVSQNRASINFRTTATRMRQSLFKTFAGSIPNDEIFACKRRKYQLLPEVQLQVDTEEFDLLLKEAERAGSDQEKAKLIKQALVLYKGDYVSDIYDSWTDALRRRFHERRLNALHWLASHTARQGDDFGCVEACESYLSVDPLSEDVVRIYMKSLARLGKIKTVKTIYKSLKNVLQQELNISASKETENLYQSILNSRT